MKINTTQNKKMKWTIASTATIVLLSLFAVYYVYGMNGNLLGWQSSENTPSQEENDATNTVDEGPATDEEKKAGDNIKYDSVKDAEEDEASDGAPSENIPVFITAANQAGPGSPLRVRAQINTITSSGVCTLTLKNGERAVTKTADVQALASFSTCKGFDVPGSELIPGEWSVVVNYRGESKEGAASVFVTIK